MNIPHESIEMLYNNCTCPYCCCYVIYINDNVEFCEDCNVKFVLYYFDGLSGNFDFELSIAKGLRCPICFAIKICEWDGCQQKGSCSCPKILCFCSKK